MTFKVVKKDDVFRPSGRRPRSPHKATTPAAIIEEVNEEIPEDEDEEAALRRKRAKKEKEDLEELAKLTVDESIAPVDPWAAEPPSYPEMNELEFTNDHIALDRPWVLADAEDVEVGFPCIYLLT